MYCIRNFLAEYSTTGIYLIKHNHVSPPNKIFYILWGEREEITNPTGPSLGLGTLASIVNDQEVLFTSKRHTKSSAMVAKQDIFLCFMFLLASYT